MDFHLNRLTFTQLDAIATMLNVPHYADRTELQEAIACKIWQKGYAVDAVCALV